MDLQNRIARLMASASADERAQLQAYSDTLAQGSFLMAQGDGPITEEVSL